jgi:hypothetical protein
MSMSPDDYDQDDDGWTEDDEDEWEDDCGLMADGQCMLAGSEHCDFCCPNRDSEDFCGSAAWRRKHGAKG